MNGHLSQVDLTDVCLNETLEVDLLIGVVTRKTIQGGGGPVAIKTTLGWVLSGSTGVAKTSESAVSLRHFPSKKLSTGTKK